jgi:acetyl esterase/lipase
VSEGIRVLEVAPPPADLRVAYGADPNQFLEFRFPASKSASPFVFFIHGGFWRARYDLKHAGWPCSGFTAAGFATCNVEYRRAGSLGGNWPASLQDLSAAWKFLQRAENASRYRYDLSRAIVAGHSAGGQLALCLAAHESSVGRAISLAGVLDLQRAWELHLSNDAVVEFLGGTPAQAAEHYREADPMQLKIAARQLVVYGANDNIVPPDFSRRYAESKHARGETVGSLSIPAAGHFDVIDPHSPVWPQVAHSAQALL